MKKWQKSVMMSVVVIAAVVWTTACSTVEYRPVELPLPLPPVLEVVSGEELDCLSDSVYERVLSRDAELRGHIRQLRAIIETNNEAAQ